MPNLQNNDSVVNNELAPIEDFSSALKAEQVNKAGRFSKSDEAYMLKNYKTISPEEIAGQLQRNPATVKKYIEEKLWKGEGPVRELSGNFELDITRSPVWAEIQQQFDETELKSFLYHFANMIAQFKYDVLATERMQIIDAVRIEILMHRSLTRLSKAREEIASIDRDIKIAKDTMDDDDPMKKLTLANLKVDKGAAEAGIGGFNKEYKELLDKKTSILKDLKATRSERIKRIEDSKETIGSYIAKIMAEPQLRKELGIEIEKMRLAKQVEYNRLSEYHTYVDGSIEQPILNSDNVKEDNN